MRTRIGGLVGTGKVAETYNIVLDKVASYPSPHEFITQGMGHYQRLFGNTAPARTGRIFELLVCEVLAIEGISPFYYQAEVNKVPDVNFDVFLYDDEQPVVLSVKHSLRERWKIAAFEARLLQDVYPRQETHLIVGPTDEGQREAERVRRAIKAAGSSGRVGITDCLLASEPRFTALLNKLKKRQFSESAPIRPVLTDKVYR